MRFARLLLAGSKNDLDEARRVFHTELISYISEHEMEFHNVFDLFLFRRAKRRRGFCPVLQKLRWSSSRETLQLFGIRPFG